MKVAIITMHCPLNYGAVLQAYALQTYVESIGHSVDVIDYRPDYIVEDQSLTYVPIGKYNKGLFRLIYICIKMPYKLKKKSLFHDFYKRHLSLSPQIYKTYNEIIDKYPDADCYLCGSDQIWSYANNAFNDPVYFLSFVKKDSQRISYASSGLFPNPLPTEMKEAIIPRINQLSAVSVRERQTKELLQPYVLKEVYEVLDPVFLLDKTQWLNVIDHPSNSLPKTKYIIVYPVGDINLISRIARLLAEKLNLPLYCITSTQQTIKGMKKMMPSPSDFIHLLNNAEYVVTNSFHGTAFSLILKKNFLSCSTNIANNRLISLLEKVNLVDRLLDNSSTKFDTTGIDYISVDKLLGGYISKSKEYLKKYITI